MTDTAVELQTEILSVARDFAQREIAPHAAEWDRTKEFPAHVGPMEGPEACTTAEPGLQSSRKPR